MAVRRNLRLEGDTLHAGPHKLHLDPQGRIFLIGLGKAALSMSNAASTILADRIFTGLATVPDQSEIQGKCTDPDQQTQPSSIQTIVAGHPLLNEGSIQAGNLAVSLLQQTRTNDLVLVLISGGGSALFEVAKKGVRVEDLRLTYHLLIKSGAPIQSINVVRKALSQSKAGGLARFATPAPVVSLIMSDVVGDQLSSIASGPTVLRGVKPESARKILVEYDLWDRVPTSVRKSLSGLAPVRPTARRPLNVLIGTNRMVVDSAASAAEGIGFLCRVTSYKMQGEARVRGSQFAQRLAGSTPGSCYLMGGETTVTVKGDGRGGRNQEFCLAAGIQLRDTERVAVMSIATDGIDGPTDAAGAHIDSLFFTHAVSIGFDPLKHLDQNNAHPILDATDSLLRTGLTGTNLNDLVVGLHYQG
jgi:hydroxypyruvate reductase